MSTNSNTTAATGFWVLLGVIGWIATVLIVETIVIVANVNDMLSQGYASFWPVFWILFTALVLSIPTAIIKALSD